MLALIPTILATVLGAVGWKLGALVGTWTGAVLSIIGTGFGYYYGRKIKESVTP